MNELEKVLERMSILRKEREQKQSKLQDGCVKVGGLMNTLMQGLQAVPCQEVKPQKQEQQQSKPSPNMTYGLLLKDDPDGRRLVASTVEEFYNSMNNYGKTPDQLISIQKLFLWALGGFDVKTVLNAFGKYLYRGTTMPTPADIIAIIDPPAPPKERLSGAVYVSLKKQIVDNIFITPKEREYMAAYEKQELDKVRGGSDELREAQAQIAEYRLKLGVDDE